MGRRVARIVQLFVAEIDEQVRADSQQIEDIHGQHLGDVVRDQLRGDAADVAEDDQQNEREAHAARGGRTVIVDDRDRPRKATAQQHHGFKDILHGEAPPENSIIIYGQIVRRYCTTFCWQKQIFISK